MDVGVMSVQEHIRRLYDSCKSISAKEAAERAGLHLTAKGRKHWTNCFLHDDRTASLAIYDDGGWYCFSCHAGGDAVKLYELLYDLKPADAAKKLSDDFDVKPSGQAPRRILTARDLNRAIGDIRWRRVNQLLNIKYKALERRRQIEQDTPMAFDKIYIEIAKESAAQDLSYRIELMADVDLLAWIKKGGTLNDI